MSALLIYQNMGLGDHIITNAIVRNACSTRASVALFVKHHNLWSVRMMFSDLPNLKLIPVSDDAEAEASIRMHQYEQLLRLGPTGEGGFDSQKFDAEFYRQAGLPFEMRWTHFGIPTCPFVAPYRQRWDYHFVHDDAERGLAIDWRTLPTDRQIVVPHRTRSITDWIHTIQSANQVHCIPSAFSLLADSVGTNGSKFFLHTSARPNGELPTYRKPWKIV